MLKKIFKPFKTSQNFEAFAQNFFAQKFLRGSLAWCFSFEFLQGVLVRNLNEEYLRGLSAWHYLFLVRNWMKMLRLDVKGGNRGEGIEGGEKRVGKRGKRREISEGKGRNVREKRGGNVREELRGNTGGGECMGNVWGGEGTY